MDNSTAFPATFTPESATAYLLSLHKSVFTDKEQMLAAAVFNTANFFTMPAAKSHHHNYAGGLVVHTAEVARNCMHLMGVSPTVQRNVIIMAALFHDVQKVSEYTAATVDNKYTIDYTSFAKLEGHVVGSMVYFAQAVERLSRDTNYITPGWFCEAVEHCILAHHGRKEWGSPVTPQTPEAWILHAADMLSAQPL